MADDDLLVTISGPALSYLLYENIRCRGNQIGFLLGETLIYITKKLTDSDREVQHTKIHINVKTVSTYPTGDTFYDTVGRISDEKVLNFLKDNDKKIVGWFNYRQDCPLDPTLRDTNIHNDLSILFSKRNRLQEKEKFLFFMLTASRNEAGGTYKFKHLMLQNTGSAISTFKSLSFKINNLGADATRPDGSDYKLAPTKSSCDSDDFDIIYKKNKKILEAASGVEAVKVIERGAQKLLDRLIPAVNESDQKVAELENEFFKLKQKKWERAWEEAQLEHELREQEEASEETKDLFGTPERKKSESPDIFDELVESGLQSSKRVYSVHTLDSSAEKRVSVGRNNTDSPASPTSPNECTRQQEDIVNSAKDVPNDRDSLERLRNRGLVKRQAAEFIRNSTSTSTRNSIGNDRSSRKSPEL